MATAYNLFQSQERARRADRNSLVDPGAAGEIRIGTTDDGFVVLSVQSSAYTLEDADHFGLGTRVTCNAQDTGITVNGTGVNNGTAKTFQVVLNSSGAKAWVAAY